MTRGFPLSVARAGSRVRVSALRGGDEMKRHLASLGFVEGSDVEVVTQAGGQVIVTVKGARFGLNRETSRNVFVVE